MRRPLEAGRAVAGGLVRFGLLAWFACAASSALAVPEPVPGAVPRPLPSRRRRRSSEGPVLRSLPSSTLLISVTAPLRASSRPMTVAPLLSEMLESAIRLPWNAVVVPSVAELPTCQ